MAFDKFGDSHFGKSQTKPCATKEHWHRFDCHDVQHSCDHVGVVGGIVVALLLALCIVCFVLRRKRNKQVGERRVAAQRQKEQAKQQKEKKASRPWLGFLRRRKGGPGAGALHASSVICAIIHTRIQSVNQSSINYSFKT